MAGMKIFEYINKLYDNNINGIVGFILGFIYAAILVFTSFSIANIRFLRKYTHKHFELCRSGKLVDDIKFICTLLLFSGAFNILIQMSFVGDALYRLLSLYLVQLPILFLMLKRKCFGYQLKKRNCILND